MTSFVDRMRETPAAPPRIVRVVGFDPDIDVAGWAQVSFMLVPNLPPKIGSVQLCMRSFQHHKCKGLARTVAAAKDLCEGGGGDIFGNADYAIVESQQLWSDPNMDRAEMFAKADDLLRIAHISGVVHALGTVAGIKVVAALPQTWKGQRKKEVDRARSMKLLGASNVRPSLFEYEDGSMVEVKTVPFDLAGKPGKWEHAMDGLGMALYGMELLGTNRWPA